MKPKKHQRKAARKLIARLKQYGLAILAGEVRSGKTLAFILAALKLELTEVLIITKKDAIPGIKAVAPNSYMVTNFHQVKNLDKKDFQLIIIDEFHRYVSNIGPKRSNLWKEIKELTYFIPIIFSSGTPTPESYASIYSPLSLTCKSPFNKYKNFTAWFKDYGIPNKIVRGYDQAKKQPLYAPCYKKVKQDKVVNAIEHLIVRITQVEAGHTHLAEDVLHNIDLSHRQKRVYECIESDKMYELPGDYTILADNAAKVPQKKHQISGGFVNANYDFNELEKKVYQFNRLPKVEYIKKNFDVNNTMIVCFYISEQEYLKTIFPHVESITEKSDGVDFSHYENLVIYSFGFHAVTYEQIRARQMNFEKRTTAVKVHFLLSGIDQYVYDAVSDKKDFTASWYKKQVLSKRVLQLKKEIK